MKNRGTAKHNKYVYRIVKINSLPPRGVMPADAIVEASFKYLPIFVRRRIQEMVRIRCILECGVDPSPWLYDLHYKLGTRTWVYIHRFGNAPPGMLPEAVKGRCWIAKVTRFPKKRMVRRRG